MAGLGLPVLPFLAMAPGGVVKDVVISQLTRSTVRHTPPLPRLSDLAGFQVLPSLPASLRFLVLLGVLAAVAVGYLAGSMAARRLPAALDWYALISCVAVIVMLLWPFGYWSHYGAFAGPFIALVLALPAGLLRPAIGNQIVPAVAVGLVAAVVIAGVGLRQFGAETRLTASTSLAASADKLIPAGACVLTNDSSNAVSANRFTSGTPGCPSMVDAYGTLLAMTDGRKMSASPQAVSSVRAVWRSAFSWARYVWLESGSQGQIPWTSALYADFKSNYRLIGLVNGPGARNAPEGGLYVRA